MTQPEPDPMRAIHEPARLRHDSRFSEDIPPYYYWPEWMLEDLREIARSRNTYHSAASRKGWRSRKRMAKARKGKL